MIQHFGEVVNIERVYLKIEQAIRLQRMAGIMGNGLVEAERVGIGNKQGLCRLMVDNYGRHGITFLLTDVGRIADNDIPFFSVGRWKKRILKMERHVNMGTVGILASNGKRLFGDVPSLNVGCGKLSGKGDSDASRACANVENSGGCWE